MNCNDRIDYTDVSYIPDKGMLFVDTSALEFMRGYSFFTDSEAEKIKIIRAKNCLSQFKSRSSKVVTSQGVLSEIEKIVNLFKKKKINTKRALSKSRENKRSLGIGDRIRFTSRSFSSILQDNKRHLKFYRYLYEFLRTETEKNSSEVPESDFADIQSYLNTTCFSEDLSFVDKELLVNLISSGDNCGLFSADKPMIGTYCEAVKHFSLSDCFVCDGVNSRTYWLK